jgi:hypothetical protein
MSWTRNYLSGEEFRNDQPNPKANVLSEPLEHKEQIKSARKAAMLLLESHTIGLKDVTINLTGHANPNHEHVDGYSNDFISIQIAQK